MNKSFTLYHKKVRLLIAMLGLMVCLASCAPSAARLADRDTWKNVTGLRLGAPGISFAINLEEAEAKSLIDRLGKAGETKALPQETVVRASPAFVHCLGEDPSAAPLAVLYLYVSDGAYGLCDMETRTCYRIDRETAETVRRIMASRKEAWGAGWEEMWP